jgi:hypothetical protein
VKSTAELRSFLVEQMRGVVAGDVDPGKAKSVSNLAQQIYNTINIEVKMAAARRDVGAEAIVPVDFAA